MAKVPTETSLISFGFLTTLKTDNHQNYTRKFTYYHTVNLVRIDYENSLL